MQKEGYIKKQTYYMYIIRKKNSQLYLIQINYSPDKIKKKKKN